MNHVTAQALLFALGVGLIIGFERGWHVLDESRSRRSTGLRDFALVGLLGGIAGVGLQAAGAWFGVALLLAVAAVGVAGYRQECRANPDIGITTELAMLLTFGLALLCALGFYIESVAAAAVTALLLRMKGELNKTLRYLSAIEVSATLQLLVLAAAVLPLLPDRTVGPFGGVNPRLVGLLVLMIAAISYVGYFAVRLLGPRAGVLTSAVLGGLTSSTAVTVAFAQMARRSPAHLDLLAIGIALASATMAPRLLLVVAAANPALLATLPWPLLSLGAVPFIAVVPLWLRQRRESIALSEIGRAGDGLQLKNPLELKAALFYGVLLTVLIVGVRLVKQTLGDAGVYSVAALSGLADVDAVSISLARAAQAQNLPLQIATWGIIIAAIVNTLAKAAIAASIGGRRLGLLVCIAFVPAAIATGVIAIVV